ncbi:MAG: single-stranded DNA-binding protein, partial [Flavobacteriales bacterium]|nr:single-stranded DNA-binding protein [Flavobacteriales bacterium]
WQDRDGNTRYTTEVHAEEMTLLDRPSGERQDMGGATAPASAAPAPRAAEPVGAAPAGLPHEMDDLPF